MSVWVTERCGSHRRRMHLCPSCCISPLVPLRSSCGAFCGVWLRLRLRRSLIYCHLPLRLWLRLLQQHSQQWLPLAELLAAA